ncbi:MAG TPA: hypothetical protein DCK95_00455, partial [Anaerolineaceae bacterium]|nr:hypothetical protein [Anaerolineaceae bacterium]
MNKLLKVVSIIIVMLFLFTACTPQTPEVEETKDEPTAEVEEPEIELTEEVEEPKEPLKVALIAPSTINDYAFTQSMYDALVVLQKEMGADALEFVYSENMFVVD